MKDLQSLVHSVHSWIGLLVGWILFAIFLTGTLTVFDNEITYWMQPELQEVAVDTRKSHDSLPQMPVLNIPDDHLGVAVSKNHAQIIPVKWQEKRTFSGQTSDPVTGKMVTIRDSQGGDFFYHFHSGLLSGLAGAWLVGAAAVAMLITLCTGLGLPHGSLKDTVTGGLRPFSQRAWLGFHQLTGLLVLPFHVLVTVSGLMLLWPRFMPRELHFLSPDGSTFSVLSTLHLIQFGGVTMRWLYFIMGMAASAMIATGLVLWASKRRKSFAGSSRTVGHSLVESLNIGTMAGLLVSIAAFFWANRLLPIAVFERSQWEVRCFAVVWSLCFTHSFLRKGSLLAWRDQLYAAAVLFGLLPLLNAFTTNSHLLITGPKGEWAVAGVDLTALAVGGLLGWVARRVGESHSHRLNKADR